VPATNQLQSQVTNENVGNGLVLNYAKTISPNLVVAGADAIGNVIGQHNANNNVSFGAVAGGGGRRFLSWTSPGKIRLLHGVSMEERIWNVARDGSQSTTTACWESLESITGCDQGPAFNQFWLSGAATPRGM
jgi:hypothetical protein